MERLGWEKYSKDDDCTVMVRWMSYVYYQEDSKFAGVEPVELLYVPYKYKCWGKGIQTK
ncbi:hypothetical protein [Bacillus cereus group sp. BceL212]|uniref:hypothetical protein n=1 Tax=Bacillus cereus group sp. BceL212 TaxID=3445018 RepID=UPI00330111BB|nr:hypothetical protein [Bacillus cereus]